MKKLIPGLHTITACTLCMTAAMTAATIRQKSKVLTAYARLFSSLESIYL